MDSGLQTRNHTVLAYRRDIDGLRALAVLLVVAYHAGVPYFTGGFVGVDVFFVISGFLITQLLQNELEKTGTLSFRQFYARRVRRLLPAVLIVVLATVLLWVSFVPGDTGKRRNLMRSVQWSLMGLANIFFLRNTGGYFDGPTTEVPLLHLWSLSVEEQFYLCWPLLLFCTGSQILKKWIVSKFSSKKGSNFKFQAGLMFFWIGGIVLASFVYSQYLVSHGRMSDAFYLMPARAGELGIGALLALSSSLRVNTQSLKAGWKIKSHLPVFSSLLGLFCIGFSGSFYTPTTAFPGVAALLPVLGTALLIWAGQRPEKNLVSSFLSCRPLVRIGLVSYSWYLWHWPLLAIARTWNLDLLPSMSTRLGLIGASYLFAEITYRWVETPFRHGIRWKARNPFQIIALGGAASLILVGLTYTMPHLEHLSLLLKFGPSLTQEMERHSEFGKACVGQDDIGTEKCHFSFTKSSQTKASAIAVWGDSHAGSYFPIFAEFARKNQLSADLYTQGDSPPLLEGPVPMTGKEKGPMDFDQFGKAAFWHIRKMIQRGDRKTTSVVLVARWLRYTGRKKTDPSYFTRLEQVKAGLQHTIAELEKTGVYRFLIILPYPEFHSSILRCLQRNPALCQISRAQLESDRHDMVEIIRGLSQSDSKIRIIDPVPLVCSVRVCPQVFQGIPVVSDDNHPSEAATLRMGEFYQQDLDWLIGRG